MDSHERTPNDDRSDGMNPNNEQARQNARNHEKQVADQRAAERAKSAANSGKKR